MAARGFTRRRRKLQKSGDLECLLPLCLPKPAVTCKNTKKRNKQVCFGFVFRSAPLPSPCSDLLLSLQVFFCFLFFCFCFRSVGAAGLLWSCCRRGTERRLGRRQRGCRCVRPEEARSCCGAGLLCQWLLLFRKQKGKQTLLVGKELVDLFLRAWRSAAAAGLCRVELETVRRKWGNVGCALDVDCCQEGEGRLCRFWESCEGKRQRWKVQWWWLRRRRRWESLLGAIFVLPGALLGKGKGQTLAGFGRRKMRRGRGFCRGFGSPCFWPREGAAL